MIATSGTTNHEAPQDQSPKTVPSDSQAPNRASGRASVHSAATRTRPPAKPRSAARAKVALFQSSLNSASKAASFSPHRSRQSDSPTDQLKKASSPSGKK